MLRAIVDWLGFGGRGHSADHHGSGHHHGHDDGHGEGDSDHGHTHGVIDPTIATTARGIWAIKWSFIILAITAAFQVGVVALTGSVALLADTIVGLIITALIFGIVWQSARAVFTRLHAEADIEVPDGLTVAEGIALSGKLRATVASHLPALKYLRIGFTNEARVATPAGTHTHHGHD